MFHNFELFAYRRRVLHKSMVIHLSHLGTKSEWSMSKSFTEVLVLRVFGLSKSVCHHQHHHKTQNVSQRTQRKKASFGVVLRYKHTHQNNEKTPYHAALFSTFPTRQWHRMGRAATFLAILRRRCGRPCLVFIFGHHVLFIFV